MARLNACWGQEATPSFRSSVWRLTRAARGELERLAAIGPVQVREVTAELVPVYLDFFDNYAFRDYPAWQSCYCIETHRTQNDDDWGARTAQDNRRDMSDGIQRGGVPGLLAL